jgi:hypothetical protein
LARSKAALAADHEGQRGIDGADFAAGDRRVEELHAVLGQPRRDPARRGRRDGAGIRHRQAALAALGDAARAQADLLDVGRVRHHGEHQVGVLGHLGRAEVGVGAELGEGFQRGRAPRPDVQGVAAAGDVDGHGAAHEAEADESDIHLSLQW